MTAGGRNVRRWQVEHAQPNVKAPLTRERRPYNPAATTEPRFQQVAPPNHGPTSHRPSATTTKIHG